MKDYEYLDNNGNYIDYFIILEDNKKMLKELEEKDEEINRLNNIINELEEEINFKIKGIEIKFNSYEELCKNAGNFGGYINLKSIKDKLQELRGDSSNE